MSARLKTTICFYKNYLKITSIKFISKSPLHLIFIGLLTSLMIQNNIKSWSWGAKDFQQTENDQFKVIDRMNPNDIETFRWRAFLHAWIFFTHHKVENKCREKKLTTAWQVT